ncbi:ceramide synthase-like [Littorina saxatilis]
MSCLVGLIVVSQVTDIMKDTHWLINAYAWFALPYFVHDVWAMYMTFVYNGSYKSEGLPPKDQALKMFVCTSPLLIAHHVIMPCIIFPCIILLRKDAGDFFVATFYMIELTIPFISARAVLAQLNMQKTVYYIIVGLLMLTSFFAVRVLVFPYLYWRYAVHAGISILDVPTRIPIKCNLVCLMILLPQLYWFWLMLRGAVKVFYRIGVRHKPEPNGIAMNGFGKSK